MPKDDPATMHLKSYKDKVLYILQKCIEYQEADYLSQENFSSYVPDLKWVAHVIKNDFLQISNSMQTTNATAVGKNRRFSKTQKTLLNLESSRLDPAILNQWVS